MSSENEKETKGAWIVHHARKISMDVSGPAEFSALDEAGKAAQLLMRLGASNESTLGKEEIKAVAKSINLNIRTELPHYLDLLKNRRLVDTSKKELQILGVSTRLVLRHASDIFDDSNPTNREIAAVDISELTSHSPVPFHDAQKYISDSYKLKKSESLDFIQRAGEIGFIDQEGDDSSNIILFNGNLFKRDSVKKSQKVLSSLSSAEQSRFSEVSLLLKEQGCIYAATCEKQLGKALFEKLRAAGVLEVNIVSNENGEHSFVTLPGSFHKFVNPMIDDSFDMAKALVSALTYGMKLRRSSRGRIMSIDLLLGALINGRVVGPATAIGADYRVLEQNRVIKLTHDQGDMYYMELLKREIGQLALEVLQQGDANAESISSLPSAPMTGYIGPEGSRERVRKNQSKPSRNHTHDILSALRGGRII